VAGAKHLKEPYEGWIAADPFRGGLRLLITGAHGFQREVGFAIDEEPAVITQLVKATLDESGSASGGRRIRGGDAVGGEENGESAGPPRQSAPTPLK
jgi:hypothetical protein